jgi:hypothetical protein
VAPATVFSRRLALAVKQWVAAGSYVLALAPALDGFEASAHPLPTPEQAAAEGLGTPEQRQALAALHRIVQVDPASGVTRLAAAPIAAADLPHVPPALQCHLEPCAAPEGGPGGVRLVPRTRVFRGLHPASTLVLTMWMGVSRTSPMLDRADAATLRALIQSTPYASLLPPATVAVPPAAPAAAAGAGTSGTGAGAGV